ncbi:MAG: hypothetical protein IT433_03705 [Phycisphaerales bacterium]|nr:hypothetical protein [Phycisphaerales bacterium]
MTRGDCPICGYDRSGDASERCPECGTTERPKPAPERLTPILRRTLYAAAAVGLLLYYKMAASTYRFGVAIDWDHPGRWLSADRISRILLTCPVGALAAAAVIVRFRPDGLGRLPWEWEILVQLVLAIITLMGIIGLLFAFPTRTWGSVRL